MARANDESRRLSTPTDRSSLGTSLPAEDAEEQWRQEVASRLDRYRARRKKKGDEDSLQFDFEAPAEPAAEKASALVRSLNERYSQSHVAFDTNFYRRANAEAVSGVTPQRNPFADDIEVSSAPVSQPEAAEPLAPEIASAEAVAADESTPAAVSAEPQAVAEAAFVSDEVNGILMADLTALPTQPPSDYDPDFDFGRPRGEAGDSSTPADQPKAAPDDESQRSDGKLIYFPKPSIRLPVEPPTLQARPREELAEPVITPPRILDVPEGIIPTIDGPLFADVRLEPEKEETRAASQIDLPLPVAAVSQRIFSGLLDTLIVAASLAVFCAIAWKMLPELPQGKPAIGALAAVAFLLWVIFHYLMLVYGGRTPGMQMAQISLRSFNGRRPTRRQLRRRLYCMLFSAASLGLGFAWALIDEDSLCWHDRISRTFNTQERLH